MTYQDQAPHSRKKRRAQWLALGGLWLLVSLGVLLVADEFARIQAMRTAASEASTDAELKIALLNVALERPRAIPLVLSGDPDLATALDGGGAAALDRLNRKLEGLIEGTQSSVIYVTGPTGLTIASSNWRQDDSFVGSNYAFREYFQAAMKTGMSEHYALGNVSRRPGLYISRRIDASDGRPLGVVIAKVEFNRLEADWNIGGKPVYVVDGNGVVLMTSVPEWRFKTVAPIDEARRKTISESLQFGTEALATLPFRPARSSGNGVPLIRVDEPGRERGDYLRLEMPVPTTSWTLHYLQPVAPTLNATIREGRVVALATLMPLMALSALWLWRRHKALKEKEEEQRARAELETKVQERTRDLTKTRDHLQAEIALHEKTTGELRNVQHELVQANRLSILGQVAAGVAHEINQPVATIRAFADNARTLLKRDRLAEATGNLEDIAALTERIGTITTDLKILARKGRTAAEPVSARLVIEGAVMLLRSRFSGQMDALDIALPDPELKVLGSRIRLEQILINLLQNALEATEAIDMARVEVRVREDGDMVVISIGDNGAGIPDAIRAQLFSPFNTSKESGLGLGLVISNDIASDYGGRIEVASGAAGTCFSVYLKRA
ncbi:MULTISPECIES: sensor histidine kinase [unclassified Agrobacterium]|uniref:sensor histidine kinase n=1 Tax=unclassified Agrobacterium TaxID=2632611 RepID=UPI00244BFE72|nr:MULTISPECIES: sensor histidine kinase [unclassified Agrobacterium]MDH0616334.1 sensor histidine kinase [Agrobacterium sp. GD03872]MDH0698921.1 sensor histidine kinase [Agrobacterium sp. GD03871]MDH1061564.1 sensor histidine kinase [Agrobacterium sp. GD03992]MDH2213107.1 sensor histidine kinase [Agrobacterium sp. GD03643]MDH2222776.1 sensor histidine kinase [Agrobacterium sp. GD03638]